jgi:hypothetical protein
MTRDKHRASGIPLVWSIVALLSFALIGGRANAQTYNLFKPATGVLKGSTSTYVTTAAASSDIRALWAGTCDITTFLRADGNCAAVGTVTSISQGTGITATPNPITTTGSIAVDQSFAPSWTGTHSWTTAGTSAAPNLLLNSSQPQFVLRETDAGTDAKNWDFSSSAGTFRLRAVNDANNSSATPFSMSRSGTVVSSIDLTSTALTWNGSVVPNVASSPTWTGAHTFTPGSGTGITINSLASSNALRVNGGQNGNAVVVYANTTAGQSYGMNIDAGTNASDHNLNLRDAAGSTTLFSVRGDGMLTGTNRIRIGDGTVGDPAFSFGSDTDTGFYLEGAGQLAASIGGVRTMTVRSNLTQLDQGVFRVPAGTAADPSYTFSADADTGMYLVGTNIVGLGGNGVRGFAVDGGHAYLENGTAGAPSLAFWNDSDTGVFLQGTNALSVSTGAAERLRISTTEISTTLPIEAVTDVTVGGVSVCLEDGTNCPSSGGVTEGTFSISLATAAAPGSALDTQTARYSIVGNEIVHLTLPALWISGNSATAYVLTGIPSDLQPDVPGSINGFMTAVVRIANNGSNGQGEIWLDENSSTWRIFPDFNATAWNAGTGIKGIYLGSSANPRLNAVTITYNLTGP